VLIALANAMEDSVRDGKMVRNPYKDKKLNIEIDNLEKSINRWKSDLNE
jgi:hypothetical protein